MTVSSQRRVERIGVFLRRLRRQTKNVKAGVWVELRQEAGRILLEDLPAIEADLPADQPELELAVASPGTFPEETPASGKAEIPVRPPAGW